MANIKLALKRGSYDKNQAYSGKAGEITHDTTNSSLLVHDGNGNKYTIYNKKKTDSLFLKKTDTASSAGYATSAGYVSYAAKGPMKSSGTAAGIFGQTSGGTYIRNGNASSGVITIPYFTVNAQGQITSVSNKTITLSHPANSITYYANSCSQSPYPNLCSHTVYPNLCSQSPYANICAQSSYANKCTQYPNQCVQYYSCKPNYSCAHDFCNCTP